MIDLSEIEENSHGGARSGAGRPKGAMNKRSIEVIEDVAAKYPDWSPLMHLAHVANDETLDVEIRLDAAKAAMPYVHSKLRPVVADVDDWVSLEGRVAKARLEAQAEVMDANPGLSERLARALARRADENFELLASRPVVLDMTAKPESAPAQPSAPPKPVASLRREENIPASDVNDWSHPPAYRAILPERQAFAETDYENAPGSFLNAYK